MRMGKEDLALAAITGVTLLIASADGARADVISQTQNFDIGTVNADANSSQAYLFNRFNPALGTLTGVKFTLESSTETTAHVFLLAINTASASTKNESSFSVEINDPALGALFVPLTGIAEASCESSIPCSDDASDPKAFNGTFAVPNGSIALFAGVLSYAADLVYTTTLTNAAEGPVDGQEHSGTIAWSGLLTVEYTYDPVASVPEPGALALFGAGLAGAAAARRRRKR